MHANLNDNEGTKADVAAGCDPKLYRDACKGNEMAFSFLCLWHEYCHEIDDIIDERQYIPERILAVFAHASVVYSHPFYRQHAEKLQLVVQLTTNSYADSIHWDKSIGWKKQWANVLNLCGIEMVLAVATICGGYEHMRALSPRLRQTAWTTHFDDDGNQI